MQQGSSAYPRVTAGKGIVVEALSDGYRVSVRPEAVYPYRGFFLVRPYPNYSPQSPTFALQVVNGTLPYEESLVQSAGYVSIDRLHWIPDDKGGPGIGSRRLRLMIPPVTSLSIPDGANTVFLKIAAHSGHSDGRVAFREAKNRTVFFTHNYLVAAEVPELKEGVIYFPLAEVKCDGAGTFAITQLSAGEPSGVIMNYYGSDTLDLSDSGEPSSSGSESSSAEPESSSADESSSSKESSSADASSSSGNDSSSAEKSSSSQEPESESDESSAASESSGEQPEESSSGGGGSGSGGGSGVYDPNKWFIVASCIRYICHPTTGIENFSGTTGYYAAKGDKILFEPEPAPPTETKPISEWYGVVMIEGPYEDRLDIPQSRLDELNNLNVGDPC